MRSIRVTSVVLLGLALVFSVVAQERDELLATTKVKEDAKIPVFVEFTGEEVAGGGALAGTDDQAVFTTRCDRRPTSSRPDYCHLSVWIG